MAPEIQGISTGAYKGIEWPKTNKTEVNGTTDPSVSGEQKKQDAEDSSQKPVSAKNASTPGTATNSTQEIKEKVQIAELVQIQNKVVAHERAHMSVGGDLAGGASYSYTTGPDGKRYITGGEVSINTPAVEDPEEKIQVMARVRAAALAPADPSAQDIRVASSASTKEAEARIELARKKVEGAYGGNKNIDEATGKPRKTVEGTEEKVVKKAANIKKGQYLNIYV